jgi:electron transfer flavoprotein alpha subunit
MSKVLVILEVAAGKLRPHCLPGITAGAEIAAKSGGTLQLLVLGADPGQAAQAIAQAGYGATGVLTLAAAGLEPFTAEAWGDAIVHAVKTTGATVIGGSASSTLRDALPRAAALLDAPLASDIVQVKSANTFTRPVSAGRALLDVQVNAAITFFTARGTEFEPAQPGNAVGVSPLPAPRSTPAASRSRASRRPRAAAPRSPRPRSSSPAVAACARAPTSRSSSS